MIVRRDCVGTKAHSNAHPVITSGEAPWASKKCKQCGGTGKYRRKSDKTATGFKEYICKCPPTHEAPEKPEAPYYEFLRQMEG